jgi:calcineurin-like phosphoesterase family protein
MIYFTSDPHIGHANIIKYCQRPFKDVQEMDEILIKNWNSVVQPGDITYVVGDLCLARPEYGISRIRRMNGQKILIEGNHDNDKGCLDNQEFRDLFTEIHPILEIEVPDKDAFNGKHQRITLCHFAMRVWNKSHRGAWHLYGHSHGTLPDDPNMLSMDVGADVHNYTPISYNQVKALMKKKTWKAVDHHGERE